MPVELFANEPLTAVLSGGTDAPLQGTSEIWTVAFWAGFPTVVSGISQFHVADIANDDEIIAVTNTSNGTWTVTRGADNTVPVTHNAGFTVQHVVSAGAFGTFAQAGAGDLGGTGSAPTVVSLHLAAQASPAAVTLTDAATVAVDASLGNHYRLTLTGNHALGNPVNPTDGQKIVFEIIQDNSGGRTLSYGTAYAFGSGFGTPLLTTVANKRDFLGFSYTAATGLWYCLAFASGY